MYYLGMELPGCRLWVYPALVDISKQGSRVIASVSIPISNSKSTGHSTSSAGLKNFLPPAF